MSYAGYFKKKIIIKKEVKCKPITQKVLFSILYITFIQSINIKNNHSLWSALTFIFLKYAVQTIWDKKRYALSKSKISLNSINNCIWPVEILVPLDEIHLKEYCQ